MVMGGGRLRVCAAAVDGLVPGMTADDQRCSRCGRWRVETWAEYERLPDDAAGPLCEGTQLGRWLNAEAGRWEDVA